jgi:hypothetical protein
LQGICAGETTVDNGHDEQEENIKTAVSQQAGLSKA